MELWITLGFLLHTVFFVTFPPIFFVSRSDSAAAVDSAASGLAPSAPAGPSPGAPGSSGASARRPGTAGGGRRGHSATSGLGISLIEKCLMFTAYYLPALNVFARK